MQTEDIKAQCNHVILRAKNIFKPQVSVILHENQHFCSHLPFQKEEQIKYTFFSVLIYNLVFSIEKTRKIYIYLKTIKYIKYNHIL